MTLSGASDLYIVEVIIYLVLFPVTLYLGYRHGSPGILGYFYLNASCAVRIAADIVSLLPANRDATHPTMTSAILSSIGLSPLLLALSGFMHEAHVHMTDSTHSPRQAKTTKRWLWIAQFQIHGVSIVGMVLAIIGSVKLLASTTPLTAAETNNAEKLRSAGAVILLLLWVSLAQYALYLQYIARNLHVSSSRSIDFQQMLRWIMIATPFAGLRCIGTILYTFDHKDSDLNPVTGALWVKVVFVFLATLGAVAGMCVSGWVSRVISSKPAMRVHGSTDKIQYETVGLDDKE